MIGVLKNLIGILKNIPIKKWSERNKKYTSDNLKKEIIEILKILSGLHTFLKNFDFIYSGVRFFDP